MNSATHSPHGGNRQTPLLRPCNALLDVQAHRQELQRDLATLDLPPGLQWLAGYVHGLWAVIAPAERQLQAQLEAARAQAEGRHAGGPS